MTEQTAGTADLAIPTPEDGGRALFDWLRRMRDTQPVWRDPNGVHHVFRHADVQRVLSQPELFSSDASRTMPGIERLSKGNLTMIDPPEHGTLRRLVNKAFGPRTITRLTDRVETLAGRLLDEVKGEEFDLVADFAYPLAVHVITELLGVPVEDRQIFDRWADRATSIQVAGPTDTSLVAAFEASREEMNAYVLEHCRARRADPGEDLISILATVEVDGDRLDDEELVNFSALLLGAGYSTTMMMIGNAVLCLEDDPAAAALLRADRSLIPDALEEVLRLRTPITLATRFTTGQVELGGVTVPPNAMVMAWMLSANHDERVFTDPERFDVRRPAKGQLAFGHGIHFCIGAALARLEGRIALNALLDRYADLRVTPGATVPMYEHGGFGVPSSIFGARALPVTVRPAESA